MGCGCKDDGTLFSGETENMITTSTKIKNFLYRKDKFSIAGLLLFLVLYPIFISFMIPLTTIVLFNKIVMGRNTDIIKFFAFTKNRPKKIKE
jgi:hypothetical protein